ncbi:MAG: MFS transporter [Pseudomonadota bacterium]|nr:MFS transporter [Pseudomonadota bacterium]
MASTSELIGAARTVSPARVFWATWLGWMLDGFDGGIYIFVLVPALITLLRVQGLPADKGHIALYGGFLFSLFMVGWACSMFWGWMADRVGRVRVMCWTMLLYSAGTALCGLAPSLAWFALFRFIAGFGVGGEWAAGTPLLHESLPESSRVRITGYLHTATPIGGLLAAGASLLVPVLGWRGVFALGALPALMVLWLRLKLPEPPRSPASRARAHAAAGGRGLFHLDNARVTWSAAGMMACMILGLWSTTFWAPTYVITRLIGTGHNMAYAQHWASISGLLMNLGTLAACLAMSLIVRHTRRRRAAMFFFLGALITNLIAWPIIALAFGWVWVFLAVLPVLGFFTNGVFALFTVWLPEMFPSVHRGFGSGFAFSLGRLLAAVGPSLVGAAVLLTGSYPAAITVISFIYLIGVPLVLMGPETAGRPLPA